MSNVVFLPIQSPRSEIRNGHLSERTKDLINQALIQLESTNPNSWDKSFCQSLLTHKAKISKKQAEHLERVLDEFLLKIEFPNGAPPSALGF